MFKGPWRLFKTMAQLLLEVIEMLTIRVKWKVAVGCDFMSDWRNGLSRNETARPAVRVAWSNVADAHGPLGVAAHRRTHRAKAEQQQRPARGFGDGAG